MSQSLATSDLPDDILEESWYITLGFHSCMLSCQFFWSRQFSLFSKKILHIVRSCMLFSFLIYQITFLQMFRSLWCEDSLSSYTLKTSRDVPFCCPCRLVIFFINLAVLITLQIYNILYSHEYCPIKIAVLDTLSDPLDKTINHKPKMDAVKQEVDRNEDMIRSALRAIASLNRIRFSFWTSLKVLNWNLSFS